MLWSGAQKTRQEERPKTKRRNVEKRLDTGKQADVHIIMILLSFLTPLFTNSIWLHHAPVRGRSRQVANCRSDLSQKSSIFSIGDQTEITQQKPSLNLLSFKGKWVYVSDVT